MGYDIFSPIEVDIQIWVSFGPILEWRQNKELGMDHDITVLKTGLKNELITPLSQLEYSIQIWPLFGPILTLWRHKYCWISKCWKNNERSNIFPQKIYMVPSLKLSIVIWLWHIALKLLWRIWKGDFNKRPRFTSSFKHFTKNLKF